jgi:hypothetical protein
MTDLTDIQRTILAAAAIRPGMRVLPLPDRIKGGAAKKVLDALLARGLIEETEAFPDELTVRDGTTLVATAAAFEALGVVVPAASTTEGGEQPMIPSGKSVPVAGRIPRRRDGTKQAMMIEMLRSPDGTTVEEIVRATGWLPHTVRGAIAGALKKRLGLEITSEKVDERGRVYRIVA